MNIDNRDMEIENTDAIILTLWLNSPYTPKTIEAAENTVVSNVSTLFLFNLVILPFSFIP